MTSLEAALRYLELGWAVIPMKTAGDKTEQDIKDGVEVEKRPHVKWKHLQKRLPTEKEIRQWFTKWPDANIALICGEVSGVFALDLDSQEAIDYYTAAYDSDIRDTMCQKTTDGIHAIFKTNGKQIPLIRGISKDIDLKGEASYIMVEPSLHPSGEMYKWMNLNPLEDGIDDILDCPQAIWKLIEDYRESKKVKEVTETGEVQHRNPEGWEQELLMGVDEPGRDVAATKLAGLYLSKDYSQGDTITLLQQWNLRNTPPLPEKDIKKCVISIYRDHHKKNARGIAEVIEKIIILRYLDGTNKYKLCLGRDKYAMITIDDLMSSRRTINKIADATRLVFFPPKQERWTRLVQIWLNAAEEKIMDAEESELGIIKEIIGEWLAQWNRQKDSEHINFSTMLKNCCIEKDGKIYFTLTHLGEDLRFRNVKITRTVLCEYLRRLGAITTTPRLVLENNKFRTWEVANKWW